VRYGGSVFQAEPTENLVVRLAVSEWWQDPKVLRNGDEAHAQKGLKLGSDGEIVV
jgi:hypothetical protein